MGQGGDAAVAPLASSTLSSEAQPVPDQPVRPTPFLRLVASEPDLASLPRTTLPDAASPARVSRQETVRQEETRRGSGAAPIESLTFDHIRERIATLPAVPEVIPPTSASLPSSPRASGIASFAGRIEMAMKAMNLPGWWRSAAVGLMALAAAGLLWGFGRRRRARASMDDDVPIQWGSPDEDEAALRATLLARRDAAAKGRSTPHLSHGYAALGEALIAMKTAAAKPSPLPAVQDQPRVNA